MPPPDDWVLPTPADGLDALLDGGFHPGALYLIAGGVASGKSTWLRQTINTALNAGRNVVSYDVESRSRETHPHLLEVTASTRFTSMKFDTELIALDGIHSYLEGISRAQWIQRNLLPFLDRHPNAIKVLTWQLPRDHRPEALGIPAALQHRASVILTLEQDSGGEVLLRIVKNRFGETFDHLRFQLPDLRPVVPGRTAWERLDEDF